MRFDGKDLTPAALHEAGPENYTWWSGKGDPDITTPGFVFFGKDAFADQVYKDFPEKEQQFPEGEGTVIGGEGFGWYGDPPKRFPHIGGVQIGTGVEIGSNVTIDRGALADTIIGHHVKIDNGVHVGHNAVIGDRSILTAHCVIGGSAVIGEDVWVGLGALIKNKVKVGNGATIGMGAVVVKDVPAGVTVVGNPAKELKK